VYGSTYVDDDIGLYHTSISDGNRIMPTSLNNKIITTDILKYVDYSRSLGDYYISTVKKKTTTIGDSSTTTTSSNTILSDGSSIDSNTYGLLDNTGNQISDASTITISTSTTSTILEYKYYVLSTKYSTVMEDVNPTIVEDTTTSKTQGGYIYQKLYKLSGDSVSITSTDSMVYGIIGINIVSVDSQYVFEINGVSPITTSSEVYISQSA
jgi:hypothetical protein